MNLFQLQERLKDFSQDQLVREMRNPSGSAPQYLVLSELQRRRRIMQEEQAQMPQQQSTVAEEAVAAAGMPQGGLAQMAQALAPQTDVAMNTAAQPVERMREGGMIGTPTQMTAAGEQFNAMLQNGPLSGYREYLTETYAEPRVNNFVGRVQQMEQQEFGRRGIGIQPQPLGFMTNFMLNPDVGGQPAYAPLPQDLTRPVNPGLRLPQGQPQMQSQLPPLQLAEGGMTSFPTFDDAGTDKFDEYLIIENIMRGNIPASEALPDGMSEELRDELARRRAMYADRKAEGGEVRRMDVGGLSGVSPRLTDFMPIGPSSRRASGRGIAITPMQMGQSIYEDYIDEMRRLEAERRGSPEGLDLTMTADEVNRRANENRYDPADANPPTVSARDIAALAGENPIDLRGEVEFPTMGAGLSSLLDQAPSRELDSVIDGLVGSGVESRFDPTDDLRTFMSPAERSRMILNDPDILDRAAALDLTPEQYISSLSPARQDAALQAAANRAAMPRAAEDRMMFGETPIGAIQSERTEEPMDETLQRILENSEAAIARESAIGMTPDSTYDAVPFARPRLSQPDLRDEDRAARTADYNARSLAADAQRMGLDLSGRVPREAPEILPSIPENINRARFADIPTGALPASNRIRFGETPVGALPAEEVSGVGSQIRALTRLAVPGMGDDADVATGSIGRGDLRGQGSLDGLFDRESPLDPRADRATSLADEAATAELEAALLEGPDMGGFLSTPAGSLPAASDTEDEDRERTRADGSGGGAGGSAGAGGGAGRGASASGDDIFEQDKWLALAQFGLSLMGSQAPTFGQALGEAGSTGIAALRQAREDQQAREAAEQARADRLAAAASRASTRGGLTASNIVSRINSLEGDQRQLLVAISQGSQIDPMTGEPQDVSALEQMFLNNQLELERLRSSLGGAYDVGSEEVFDATGS